MAEPNPNPHSNYFEYQPTKDLNVFIREYGQAFLNDNIPAAPVGMTNIVWQTDSKGNVSAYVAAGGGVGGQPVQASTFEGTISGAIPGSVFVLPSSPDPESLILQFNGQVLTPNLGYILNDRTVTVSQALENGDGLNANYEVNGGGGGSGLVFLSSVMAPSEPGNFQVTHSLGKTPTGAIIQMTSGGLIWFQSPIMYDSNNVYLVASDGGLTGFVQVFG